MRVKDPVRLSSAIVENIRYLENLLNTVFNFDHDALSNVGVDDHHVKYTDGEVDSIVATHDAITDAHHAKYTDAEVDTIVATHTANADAHHVEGAANTADRIRGATLADKTTFSAINTMEDWGPAGGLNMGSPGITVFVTGHVTGSLLGASGVNRAGKVEVGITLDGGSTWTYGTQNWAQVDDVGTGHRRTAVNASHYRTGTATGEVKIRVRALISGGVVTDLDFVTGTVTASQTAN